MVSLVKLGQKFTNDTVKEGSLRMCKPQLIQFDSNFELLKKISLTNEFSGSCEMLQENCFKSFANITYREETPS